MYDVVALGELLIDFIPLEGGVDGYPILAAKPGGAPGNYLATLAAYGAKTAFLGKVGSDAFGQLLLSTLKAADIETRGIVEDATVFTTLSFVTLNGEGDRSFSFARKPGADTCIRFEELDLSIIDETRIFHFGTVSLTDEPARGTTQKAVQYASTAGKLITYDPNLRASLWSDLDEAKRQILWGLQYADIVKISDEEVDFILGCSAEEGAERMLEEYDVGLAMVTLGAKGCILQNKDAKVIASCPRVTPVDTTGAGDIFGGSAVSRILKLGKMPDKLNDNELADIADFACAAASLSTQTPGGIPSIPAEDEVMGTISRPGGGHPDR